MNHKKFLGAASAALIIVIALFLLAPGAAAAGKYKSLYKFKGGKGGARLMFGLILDQAGNLYGTALEGGNLKYCEGYGGGGVFKLEPNADGKWTESVLYSFKGEVDGSDPNGTLVFDQAGNLYGTTCLGGVNGKGVVYKLTPNSKGNWSESVLCNFCSLTNCSDGLNPAAGVIFDQAGNLYGTGNGGVFKLTPNRDGSWSESVLYNFCRLPNCTDGTQSFAPVTFDQTGNLYGTIFGGGPLGYGGVFKLAPNLDGSWTESVLHSFCGGKHCRGGTASFNAGLVVDSAGAIYGTTAWGGRDGKSGCPHGCGVVFKLTPNSDGSWKEAVLHQFTGGKDGLSPDDGVIFDQAGNLVGTAPGGGNLGCGGGEGCGVVFKLTPNTTGGWKETVLHAFADKPGAFPYSGVVFDAAGNLYGTTGRDTVFEITP